MATDKSSSAYRGLLVQDPRITQASLWGAESLYGEASPLPGVPVAQGDYEMVLQSGGSQSSKKALRLQSMRGGHPIPGGGGGFVWKNDTDAGTLWRGWDVPNVATKWEAIDYTGTFERHKTPHALTLANGKVVLVEQLGAAQVATRVRSVAGVWAAAVVVFTASPAPTYGIHPCLCLLPDGSILLFHWIEDSAVSEAQVRVWRSTNDGATWTMVQSHALREWKETNWGALVAKGFDYSGVVGVGAAGYDPGRLRAAHLNGQILLVAEARLHDNAGATLNRDVFVQWASDDLGENFLWIDTWDKLVDAEGGRFHEVLAVNGKFFFFYIPRNIAASAYRTASSAFAALTNSAATATAGVVWATVAATTVTDGDLAACVDEDDAIWLVGRSAAVPTWNMLLLRSHDYGETWDEVGQSSVWSPQSQVIRTTSNFVYMENLTVAPQWGRLLVAHTWESVIGTYDDSLGMLYLGGSSTVTMPGFQKYATDLDRVGWEVWWGPLDIPTSMGWGSVGAGTFTLQVPGELRIVTAAQLGYLSRVPAGTGAQGITVLVDMQVISGGDPSTDAIAIRLVNDTTNDVSIRFGQTAIRVWDNVAGTQVGGDILVAPSAGVQVLASMAASKISVWARATDTGHDRKWTVGPSNAAVAATVSTNAAFRWGHLILSTATSDWVQVSYTSDQWNGLGLHLGQINPDDLWARTYSGRLLSVDDGVRIRAIDGPARRGDLYNLDTRYEFPVTRILPAEGETRSPRVRWRSVDTTVQRIAFTLDSGLLGTQDSRSGHDIYGIGLFGINWRTGLLQRYDADTATWVTMATLDAATGMTTMEYARIGHTVQPNTPTSKPQLFTNEMVGGTFALSAAVFRKIQGHGEGVWDSAISGKRLALHLTGVLAGDPLSGTGSLWSPSLVCLVNLANVNPLSAWRIQIDAQSNADGYFEIGKLVIGPVNLFGTQYSWGRSIENVRGWRREVAIDGASRVRNVAPDARLIEFGWSEGVDVGDALGADPDYIRSSETAGASSVASRHGTSMEMQALSRLTRGQSVVYLPRVPKSTGAGTDVVQLVRPHQMLYGVIDSDVRIETVLGDEMESAADGEVQRVATVAIREEV